MHPLADADLVSNSLNFNQYGTSLHRQYPVRDLKSAAAFLDLYPFPEHLPYWQLSSSPSRARVPLAAACVLPLCLFSHSPCEELSIQIHANRLRDPSV